MKRSNLGRKYRILHEYFRTTWNDGFDEYREKCLAMSILWVKKKLSRLHTKDELQDLQQDAILCFIESMEKYNEAIGRFYGLFKLRLKSLDQQFMARYIGVNMPYKIYLKLMRENGGIDIYVNGFEEWMLGYVNYRKLGVFE